MNDAKVLSRRSLLVMLLCVPVLLGLSLVGWLRIHVDTSLEPMLPQTSDATKMLTFLRDSSFSTKAILWLHLTDDKTNQSLLFTTADTIEKKLDPKIFKGVVKAPPEADAVAEAIGMMDQIGQLLGPEALEQTKEKLTPEALSKQMREDYKRLLKPEGMFMQSIIRKDPLGISVVALERLQQMTSDMDYRVKISHGRFLHEDGRDMMLVLETTSSALSVNQSQVLWDHLQKLVADAPPGVKIIPIAAQIHTAQNQEIMSRDIKWVGFMNLLASLLILTFVVRWDPRVLAVFLLPVVTVGTSIGLCALIYRDLSVLVLGMSATMVGSAMDYGIFVYIVRCMNKSDDPQQDLRRLRKTLMVAVAMALGVFASFFFSEIPAYRQLGCLTTISLVLSMLGAMYPLPWILGNPDRRRTLPQGMSLRRWGRLMRPVAAGGLVFLVFAAVMASRVKTDSDLSRFDGITEQVRQNEKSFQKIWSRNDTEMAMLVVTGQSRAKAQETNDKVYDEIQAMRKHDESHFQGAYVSMASFWPSLATRQANLARWKAFWTAERIEKLRHDMAKAGQPYGFSAHAFDPFFNMLEHPDAGKPPTELLDSLGKQFVARTGDQWQMMNYFQDTPANVTAVRAITRDNPEALVVSRMALNQTFVSSAIHEVKTTAAVSVTFIVLVLLVVARGPFRAFLVIFPAVAGLLFMLMVLSLMDLPINIATIVAGVVVLAVQLDYGVFVRHAWQGGETFFGQGMTSTHLSALTTLAATGSLLVAHHPTMFLVGVSLTSGLGAGYLSAIFILPGLYDFVERIGVKTG